MHSNFYKGNRAYAERLRDSDPREFQTLPQLCSSASFHQKYIHALSARLSEGSLIVDVGCGAGQVIRSLAENGFRACGFDVSETCVAMAREHAGDYRLFDGHTLPLDDNLVDSIGAFNVLEHVPDPVALLDEMQRVLRPGGRIVVSSPNFLRVIGWRDYHPHMRGIFQKWRNFLTLLSHARSYKSDSKKVIFEKLIPLEREPMQPDDDAIAATSALDFQQYFLSRHFTKIKISCVDRPLPFWMEKILDAAPLRFFILNSFCHRRKTNSQPVSPMPDFSFVSARFSSSLLSAR